MLSSSNEINSEGVRCGSEGEGKVGAERVREVKKCSDRREIVRLPKGRAFALGIFKKKFGWNG